MKKLLIGILIPVLLAGLSMLMFRHFVTNGVTDIGGMENPEYTQVDN